MRSAGDVKDSKRSTVQASDVLRALEEVELPEFAEALRGDLQAFKDGQASQRKRRKKPLKKEEDGVGEEGAGEEGGGEAAPA